MGLLRLIMDYKKLFELKANIDLLISGVDPQSGIKIENDTIIKSNFNRNLLAEVSELIEKFIKLGVDPSKINKRLKLNFHLSQEQKIKINITDIPIPISTFVHTINEHIDSSTMKKLRATQVTSWLCENGYLTELVHDDGKVFKILTEKSASIGMSAVKKINAYKREYDINLYNADAQRYIIEHLDEIVFPHP